MAIVNSEVPAWSRQKWAESRWMDTEWHTGLQSSAVAVAALVQCGPQIDALDRLMAPSPDDGVIVLDTIDNKKEREQLWICNGNVTNIATDPRWVYKGV